MPNRKCITQKNLIKITSIMMLRTEELTKTISASITNPALLIGASYLSEIVD